MGVTPQVLSPALSGRLIIGSKAYQRFLQILPLRFTKGWSLTIEPFPGDFHVYLYSHLYTLISGVFRDTAAFETTRKSSHW
jgi:hypothetical protein